MLRTDLDREDDDRDRQRHGQVLLAPPHTRHFTSTVSDPRSSFPCKVCNVHFFSWTCASGPREGGFRRALCLITRRIRAQILDSKELWFSVKALQLGVTRIWSTILRDHDPKDHNPQEPQSQETTIPKDHDPKGPLS